MPVLRVRPGDRGPVVARTENLDAWLSRRSLKNHGRIRPDLEATFNRAASLRATAREELRVLLRSELRVGTAMTERAMRTKNVRMIERYTAMARQAYDIILRLTLRMKLSEVQSPQFEKDLESLKVNLRKLGEDL